MTWEIISPTGAALGRGETELQAWIKTAFLDGLAFPWEVLREWVETGKELGYRAVQREAV